MGAEVKIMLDKAYLKAQTILANNMDTLNKVAQTLMEKEVISAEEFEKIIR